VTAKWIPAEAARLLRLRHLIEYAADPIENPAWSHARATTKDAHGELVADHMKTSGDARRWAIELERLMGLTPSELSDVLEDEPTKRVDMPREGRSPRPIGVPTFLRRLLSIHVGNVLTGTAEEVLPASVIAYRRDHEDPVIGALRLVSRAVWAAGLGKPKPRADGPLVVPTSSEVTRETVSGNIRPVRFWAKLDFSGYFSSIPRWAIRRALAHHGYSEEFNQLVMALVRAPVVKVTDGHFDEITSKKGTEQGMAESAVLANLVPFELDAWFGGKTKRLLYIRYCDDLFVGGQTREEVVVAVRRIMAWARKLRIQLKGVSPGQGAATLVHDVCQTRIDLLGAEIDQNGTIWMPLTKLKDKLGQLGKIDASLRDGVIRGTSMMAGGRGVEAHDVADFQQVHDGFVRYWRQLNPSEAERADTLISKTFPTACTPRSGGPGTVWHAWLWGCQTDIGADLHPDAHSPGASLTNPRPGAPSGPEAGGGVSVRRCDGWEDHLEPGPIPQDDVLAQATCRSCEPYTESEGTAVDSDAPSAPQAEEALEVGNGIRHHAARRAGPMSDREAVEDAPLLLTEGRNSHRFESPSTDELLEELFRELPELGGSAAEPPARQHPSPEVSEIDVFLDARRGRRGSIVTTMTPTRDAKGVLIWSTTTRGVPGRPESAIVRAMTDIVAKKMGGTLSFGLASAFVPKALVQRGRAIRSPLLYSRLRELHDRARERGVRVEIIGPLRAPEAGASSV
jgi:hypothetical protein